jgi:hypothetical protein
MVMSPTRLEVKNDCAGEDQQQFTQPNQIRLLERHPEPSDSKIWSWVIRDLKPIMIVLAGTSRCLPDRPTEYWHKKLHFYTYDMLTPSDISREILYIFYVNFRTIHFPSLPYSVRALHVIEWCVEADVERQARTQHDAGSKQRVIGLFFMPEDGGNIFLRNVGWQITSSFFQEI